MSSKTPSPWWDCSKESVFSPSKSSFMINYRVDDLDGMIANLKNEGIKIIQGPGTSEQGKFAWIVDPDDNKIEL